MKIAHIPLCHGHKPNGDPCGKPAMSHQNVCKSHGGNAPQNLAAATRRRTEARARVLVETYGRKIETTAVQALLDEVQWTAGHVAWLRERVMEIEQDQLVWGKSRAKTGGHDHGVTEEAAPSVWLKLYQAERTHLVKVCSEAIRAGIEERRVKLAEQEGALVAQVIRAILGDLNLSDEQQAKVVDIVPRHLRALAG